MAASLKANALADLDSVKSELGITDSGSDALLTARINRVSDSIEKYCDRQFRLGLLTRDLSVSVVRSPRLVLPVTPLLVVQSITINAPTAPDIQDPANWQLEDSECGWVYRSARWPQTAIRRPDIVQDFDPATDQQTLRVRYVGGYVSLKQAMDASGWPGAAQTVNVGTLCRVGSSPNEQLWLATVTPNSSGTESGVTGALQPSWPASPTAGSVLQRGFVAGTTVTDGTVVWAYLGTVGTTGLAAAGSAITLPEDLQAAAMDCVMALWRTRGQDTTVTSESISGIASVSYGPRGLFPPSAQGIIDRYRNPSVQ